MLNSTRSLTTPCKDSENLSDSTFSLLVHQVLYCGKWLQVGWWFMAIWYPISPRSPNWPTWLTTTALIFPILCWLSAGFFSYSTLETPWEIKVMLVREFRTQQSAADEDDAGKENISQKIDSLQFAKHHWCSWEHVHLHESIDSEGNDELKTFKD